MLQSCAKMSIGIRDLQAVQHGNDLWGAQGSAPRDRAARRQAQRAIADLVTQWLPCETCPFA